MEPWPPARVRPQKEAVSPRGLPGGRAWPGSRVSAECGALLGLPALTSVLSPAGPAVNVPTDNGPKSKESRLSPDPPLCLRKAKSVIFAQDLLVWPCSLPETHLGLLSPWRTKEKFPLPTAGRRQTASVASRASRWPQAKGWQKVRDAVALSQASFPQTICKYLLRVCLPCASCVRRPVNAQRCPV